jgi:hypothetical protein
MYVATWSSPLLSPVVWIQKKEEFMKQIENVGGGTGDHDIEIAKANIRAYIKASMLSA